MLRLGGRGRGWVLQRVQQHAALTEPEVPQVRLCRSEFPVSNTHVEGLNVGRLKMLKPQIDL